MKLTDHFDSEEFKDPETGQAEMDPEFMLMLESARSLANIPFHITSGFRSPGHNAAVGGVADSAHVKGLAADISCNQSSARFKIVKSLLSAGFNRIEVAGAHIHVDLDKSKPQNVMIYSDKA